MCAELSCDALFSTCIANVNENMIKIINIPVILIPVCTGRLSLKLVFFCMKRIFEL